MNYPNFALNYPLFITGFKAIVIVTAAWLMVYLLWRIARIFFRNYIELFGASIAVRVLSLGITALVFKETVAQVLWGLFNFIRNVADVFTRTYFIVPDKEAKIAEQVSLDFNSLYQNVIAVFGQYVGSIAFNYVFLALAFWVFTGQLLSAFLSGQAGNTMYFTNVKSHVRQNLLLGMVILSSIYLIIAAIASLPGMADTGKPGEDVSKSKLISELDDVDKAYSDTAAFSSYIMGELDPALHPQTVFSNLAVPGTEGGKTHLKGLENDYGNLYNKLTDQIAKMSQEHKIFSEQLKGSKATSRRSVTSAYNAWMGKLINGEKGTYFAQLTEWYNSVLMGLSQDVSSSRQQIEDDIKVLNSHLEAQRDGLKDLANQLSTKTTEAEATAVISAYVKPTENFTQAGESMDYYIEVESAPKPDKAGEGLGPFSIFAGWLMQTNSTPLVLITGMFGFGLFGASISSIIKKRMETAKGIDANKQPVLVETEPAPYVEDLGGVIIRGVSATLVVFLAVQGGLVVLANGTPSPNPYALFLICMIGAVFSERVWEWAKDKIFATLPDTPDPVTTTTTTTTSTTNQSGTGTTDTVTQ
jgi:hypothetical protein